jgi:transcription elongation factor GreA
MKRTPITQQGANQLREELRRLKSEDRPTVIRAIADARGHGDLSENAEFNAAREQQGFIEGRIKQIEWRLGHAHVIDPASLPRTGKITFGSTVELEDEAGNNVSYQIVGDDEADLRKGMISINSPIAMALIGKQAGDPVEVVAPGGKKTYEIVEVRYG